MANILVLGVKVPFTVGGQDVLVASLLKELRARGHRADVVEIPYTATPKEGLLNQAAIWRSLPFDTFAGHAVDLIIPTKFPSYFARHPRKSLWLVHQHRPIYDLYGGRYSDISDDPRDEQLRRTLVDADTRMISECQYISGISQNVIDRLWRFNGIGGDVLYPPLALGTRYHVNPAENYILSVGRICSIKRVDMMIKALPIVHNFVKLKVVGAPDEPHVMEYLKNEIDKHHLWERVEFVGRVSDDELLDLYSRSLAVYYAPHNEDYGYVTLEGMASSKPVITAHDSGGVLEFIKHEVSGLVVEPTTDAIGHAANRLIENREFAASLGCTGRAYIDSTGMLQSGWNSIIDGLLSPLPTDLREAA